MTTQVRVRSRWQSLGLMLRRRVFGWVLRGRSKHRVWPFVVMPGDVVSDEIIVAGLYEEAVLVPLFDQLLAPLASVFKAGTAVDVGGNIGNHTLFFAKHFRQVIAFEPNPVALAVLRCNVALSNAEHRVTVVPCGLSDKQETLTFRQNQSGNLGGSGFAFAGLAEAGQEIKCDVRRGDDILTSDMTGGKVDLIKLDIEGAEFAAMRGLQGIIARDKPTLLFESHRAAGPSGSQAIFAFLRGLGYASFVAVDEVGAHGDRAWRKLLRRLMVGEQVQFVPIDQPEDRFYQLIVARPSAS